LNVLVVDNYRAGQAGSGLYSYARELVRRGSDVTVRPLDERGLSHATRDASSFDRVVAAGGDGTVSAVAYALRETRVPVVVYPAGTGNLAAINLGMPTTPSEIADLTLVGVPMLTDLGEITCTTDGDEATVGFINAAGCGFDARIMDAARELKPTLGVGAYFVGAMQNLTPTVAQFRVELDDDRVIEAEGIAVVLINFAKMVLDLSLAHDSSGHDGLLEVMILRTKNVAGLVPAVWSAVLDRISGDRPATKGLEVHRASAVKVHSDPPLAMQYDGDLLECTTPFEGRVLPDAATFVVPEGHLPKRAAAPESDTAGGS
jgi:diacylglycerol kinase (ATP)